MAHSMQKSLNFVTRFTTALFLLVTLSCSTTEDVKKGYPLSRQKSAKVSLSRKAVDQFFQQVQPAQKEIEKLYGLAVQLQKRHRHYPAIDTFKEILQQDPDNIKALNGIAVSFDLMGDHAAAAAHYRQALKINPGLDHIWNNLGYCYFLQNRLDLSIDAYQKAIAMNPAMQKYHNNLALVSVKQRRTPGSQNRTLYTKVLASNDPVPDKKSPQSDGREAPKGEKSDVYKHQTGSRVFAETIPFTSLPALKSVQNIAVMKRPKIHIQANYSEGKKTALTISKVTNAIPAYHVSLPKRGLDGRVITPPRAENQKDPRKHLRMNARLKKKWAKKKIGLKQLTKRGLKLRKKAGLKWRTMVAKQTMGIQIIGLEVSNGNGIRHLAHKVSKHLKNKGVQVSRITNAGHFQYPRTRLYYRKGLLEKARELARLIPGRQDVVEVPAFEDDHVRLKLLLGKDISSAGMLL